MSKSTNLKNSARIAAALAATLTLAGCEFGAEHNSGANISAEISTGGAKSFAFSKVKSLSGSELGRQRFQCETLMREMNDGESTQYAPVFEFKDWNDEDKMLCEVKDVVATSTDLYLRGRFLDFRLTPASAGGAVDRLNCGILRVPMDNDGSSVECLGDLTVTEDGLTIGYFYSELGITDNNEDIYFARTGGLRDIPQPAIVKYSKNEGLVNVFDASEVEQAGDFQRQWSVSTLDGGKILMDYFGNLGLMDTATNELELVGTNHAGNAKSKRFGSRIITSKYEQTNNRPSSGSMTVDLRSGAVGHLNKLVDTNLVIEGGATKDDSMLWAAVPNLTGTKYCLNYADNELSNADNDLYEYGDKCTSITTKALSSPRSSAFFKSKVGDTNYAYTFIRNSDESLPDGGWSSIGAITYIDLNTNDYVDNDILSLLDMSEFAKINTVGAYADGIVIGGLDHEGLKVKVYLDQKTMTEFKPQGEVPEIHSPIEIINS